MELQKRASGVRPVECPWLAYSDPFVREVLGYYRSTTGGMDGAKPALLIAADLPNVVWEGVNYYHEVTARIRAHDDELRRRKPPTAR